MPLSDDAKRQALLAAQGAKEAVKADALQGVEASSADVDKGPTTLPGQNPGYGRNYNPAPEQEGPNIEPGG